MNPYTLHRSLLDPATITTAAAMTTSTANVHALTPKMHPNTSPNVPDIVYRVILIGAFATVALWANHEASKGFSLAIVNDAGKYSSSGKRFSLFYESNDRATRIVLNTSRFVENLLYPDEQDLQHTKKQINRVTLRLGPVNFPTLVSVYSQKPSDYVIMLSPSIMETSYNNDAFVVAVLQGMARVWLWDGNGATPHTLLNGMVEYISILAGFRSTSTDEWNSDANDDVNLSMSLEKDKICWKNEDPKKVAGFLKFYDQIPKPGGGGDGGGAVVRRLNKGMINSWNDGMMDDALGMTGQHACGSHDILTTHHNLASSI